jgi:hypothetical protein
MTWAFLDNNRDLLMLLLIQEMNQDDDDDDDESSMSSSSTSLSSDSDVDESMGITPIVECTSSTVKRNLFPSC